MGLYDFLMSVLDGSIFVSVSEVEPPPKRPQDSAKLDESDLEPAAPPYTATGSSPAALHARLERTNNFQEVLEVVSAYATQPYSTQLLEPDIIDIILKFTNNPSETVR